MIPGTRGNWAEYHNCRAHVLGSPHATTGETLCCNEEPAELKNGGHRDGNQGTLKTEHLTPIRTATIQNKENNVLARKWRNLNALCTDGGEWKLVQPPQKTAWWWLLKKLQTATWSSNSTSLYIFKESKVSESSIAPIFTGALVTTGKRL